MYQGKDVGTTNLVVLEDIAMRLRDILDCIDATNLPADIGAHIDLAICRLEDLILMANPDRLPSK